MNETTPIIRTQGLTKRFGKTVALDRVDLDIAPGGIIGLLGANGAGKSTLLRHLIGLYAPDDGTCATLGCDAIELKQDHLAQIGYVHQDGELLDWMTGRQLIEYVSAYYPNWNRDLQERFIEDFELPVKGRVGKLSPGMRQRMSILLAICFEPELLILDEPAAALDPIARTQFLEWLLNIIQDGNRTIIISSHILSDVEKVIDRVIIMKKGRIRRHCGLDELQEEYCRIRVTALNGDLPAPLPFANVFECQNESREALLTLKAPPAETIENFEAAYHCTLAQQALSLDELFRIVISEGP